MSLTSEQVRQVAHLARLEMSPAQLEAYTGQLSSIFELVGQLAQARTEGVAPMAHPLDMVQRLRPDAVSDRVGDEGRAVFQAIAPAVAEGLYLVPRVLE